ncbi:unnamed protein product [Meganyctiphanes norvegica]|uniref:Uncharacterized protein n=1 Tax=Meganyctiphanes norvegica TaxID=48144 RepID=A0AAV2R7E2_MEGNR
MTHMLAIIALVAGFANFAMGFSPDIEFPMVDSQESRQFFFTNATSVTIGTNSLIFGLAAALGLAALAALAYFYTAGDDSGYSGSSGGYSGSSSGYSSRNAKFNPYGINWESLSILDWITMGQEAWDKFDPTNLECQKRLICEIHQDKNKVGGPVNTMVEMFGYLHYAEILSLPDELKNVLEEYMDASEKGRTIQKDCGEVFTACDFSMNGILSKFSTNKI